MTEAGRVIHAITFVTGFPAAETGLCRCGVPRAGRKSKRHTTGQNRNIN